MFYSECSLVNTNLQLSHLTEKCKILQNIFYSKTFIYSNLLENIKYAYMCFFLFQSKKFQYDLDIKRFVEEETG